MHFFNHTLPFKLTGEAILRRLTYGAENKKQLLLQTCALATVSNCRSVGSVYGKIKVFNLGSDKVEVKGDFSTLGGVAGGSGELEFHIDG